MGGFGFACGLPLPLTGFTLRQWMAEGETSLAAIGFSAAIGLAYTLKFLWSPMLDQAAPPGLGAILGQRRGWLVCIQAALALACALLAFQDPVTGPAALVASAVLIAFCSASQDIVVDAWRIESFPERQQGVALAAYIWGYRLAFLTAGAGAIFLANVIGWRAALLGMAGLAAAAILVTLAANEPAPTPIPALPFQDRLRQAVVEPFRDLWHRSGAVRIISFILLFKLGEALAHTMAPSFYRAMGFDRAQVALATGVPGLAASLTGAMAGGWLILRLGIGRALVLTGFVQMASMTLYFALAVSGGDGRILLAKVMLENFAEALADAAFITYLSSLCDTRFTATQYALLSSLAAVGSRTLGGLSGVAAAALGWTWFYALTIFAAVPAMLIMLSLLRRPPLPHPNQTLREATP